MTLANLDLKLNLDHLAHDVDFAIHVLLTRGVVLQDLELATWQTVNEDNLCHQLILVCVELSSLDLEIETGEELLLLSHLLNCHVLR